MLVHKGGQINSVQLITGVRIAEMSQLQNCSVICTKNGRHVKMKKERKFKVRGRGDVYKDWKLCEKVKVGGGGQGRCERRSEAFVKIQKKFFLFIYSFFFSFFFFFGGGGGVGPGWM